MSFAASYLFTAGWREKAQINRFPLLIFGKKTKSGRLQPLRSGEYAGLRKAWEGADLYFINFGTVEAPKWCWPHGHPGPLCADIAGQVGTVRDTVSCGVGAVRHTVSGPGRTGCWSHGHRRLGVCGSGQGLLGVGGAAPLTRRRGRNSAFSLRSQSDIGVYVTALPGRNECRHQCNDCHYTSDNCKAEGIDYVHSGW